MTNAQEISGSADSLQRNQLPKQLLFQVPLAVGGVIILLLTVLWIVPVLQRLNEANQRLHQKQEKAAQVPLLRQQLAQAQAAQQRADVQRSQLLALIAGSGDLSTFLTQVDRAAQRHRVELTVLEPMAAPVVPEDAAKKANSNDKPAAAVAPADPLVRAGLDSTRMTLAARGTYPNLLAFMRAIERLSLLVGQSNLQLKVPDKKGGSTQSSEQATLSLQEAQTELRFDVALYSEKAKPMRPTP